MILKNLIAVTMFSFLAKALTQNFIGLLIISGVGLVIYSAIRVTGLKDFKGEGNIIHAYFDDVAIVSTNCRSYCGD